MGTELLWKTKPAPPEIRKLARAYFMQDARNQDKDYDESRGAVNHLRHACTNYDTLRYSVRVDKQHEDEDPDINALKNRVLDMIVESYPELKTECQRQKEWLSTRLAAHQYTAAKYNGNSNGNGNPLPVTDLIGAEKSEILELQLQLKTLQQTLIVREGDVKHLKEELTKVRTMTMGDFYDEFKKLQEQKGNLLLLQTENSHLRNVLSGIQTQINELNIETATQKTKNLPEAASKEVIQELYLKTLKDSNRMFDSGSLRSTVESKLGKLPYPVSYYLKEAIAEGRVKTEGEKRYTTYHYAG
jgi:hypothetical protein